MLPVPREIEPRWPLDAKDKSVIAQFIGLQMVRGPLWYEWHRKFERDGFADLRKLEDNRTEPDHAGIDATERWLATDTQQHVVC